jgi:glycine hydroxymethyltransferase
MLTTMDSRISDLVSQELRRQQQTISLIASENYASPAVLQALSSVLGNKYAEGYPGARYYAGVEVADKVEQFAQEQALAAFGLQPEAWSVNVQPYSGSPANLAVYTGLLNAGDTILALSLSHGAHLTHGHSVSLTGKLYTIINYSVDRDTGSIDYDEVERLAGEHKPALIICGGTAIPRQINFNRFAEIGRLSEAKVLADISHIAGLVAAGVHESPFAAGIDVVTTTTHKTLRGPRGAMIFSKPELAAKINKAVFPGLQGGPHLNAIAGIAQALVESQTPQFKLYGHRIVSNAKVLAEGLRARGYNLVSGGTDNHLLLIDLRGKGISGKLAQEALEKVGIISNMNSIPYDTARPMDPSGLRLGTPAVTTRGMGVAEMEQLAQIIDDVLLERVMPNTVCEEVMALCRAFPIPDYSL